MEQLRIFGTVLVFGVPTSAVSVPVLLPLVVAVACGVLLLALRRNGSLA